MQSGTRVRLCLAVGFDRPDPRSVSRSGIGSALIQHAEDIARRMGHARLFLYMTTVESLYAAWGWQVVSSERYGDVVIMARNL